MISDVTTERDAQELIGQSNLRPLLLLKHSTRCPVSSRAWREFQAFSGQADHNAVTCARVLVVEHRLVSLWFADALGVTHASPQVILIIDGTAVWNASHLGITVNAIRKALDAADTKTGS